ncbi:MAG: GNAT family N-acetyltransferase [Tenericutes bacterium]|nr:GNAT family N-acetyltransferase [Mycoplasmatota bacterium]
MSYKFIECLLEHELNDAKSLLLENGLSVDDHYGTTIGIYDGNKMIATGSLYKNVIKMIAVDPSYKGKNLTDLIMTHLIQILNSRKISKYFLFTTPKSKMYFLDYNFSFIYENEDIVMLENSFEPIDEKLHRIKSKLKLKSGRTASIVMNCNPVTLGHLYLIETCAKENDQVIIFLVEEDLSIFPFKVRYQLLKAATKHLKHVHIVPSTPYIISAATFPTYFLKELTDATRIYMDLDIHIFQNFFMSIFNIDFRYVGTEPFDQTTDAYNKTMQRILKDKLIMVERLEKNDKIISASMIRKLAKEKKYDELKPYVPHATYKFLKSAKGKALLLNE